MDERFMKHIEVFFVSQNAWELQSFCQPLRSAIDNLMAQDPTSICTLIKNFQDMLLGHNLLLQPYSRLALP